MLQATRAQLEDNASPAPFRFVALRFGDTASLWPANSDPAAQGWSLAYWTRAAGGDDDFSVMVLARVWCQLAVLGRARVVRNRGMACTDAITSRLASGVACRVCRPRVQAGTVMHSVVRLLCFSALAFLLPTPMCSDFCAFPQVGAWAGQPCGALLALGPASECWLPETPRRGHQAVPWPPVRPVAKVSLPAWCPNQPHSFNRVGRCSVEQR